MRLHMFLKLIIYSSMSPPFPGSISILTYHGYQKEISIELNLAYYYPTFLEILKYIVQRSNSIFKSEICKYVFKQYNEPKKFRNKFY